MLYGLGLRFYEPFEGNMTGQGFGSLILRGPSSTQGVSPLGSEAWRFMGNYMCYRRSALTCGP